MFPPGRARLATIPSPTGSATATMTRGIDVVAFFTARVAGRPSGNDHVHLQGDQLSDENRKALILSTWTSPRSRSRRRRTTIRADRSSVLAEIRDQSPDLLLEPVDPEPTRVPAPLRPVRHVTRHSA